MKRYLLPVLFGLAGAAILIALGVWQVQRLAWKEAVLADIAAHIAAAPVDLPRDPDPVAQRYLPVTMTGAFTGEGLEVLASRKQIGAGVRVIAVFLTDTGRRVLVDRGFVPEVEKGLPRSVTIAQVTGNLHWPDEVDSFTPAPDAGRNLWFARDVPAMAAALGTEPLLVVARVPTGDDIDPLPVDTSGIPNDHLTYAITWFSLAVVWLGMTVLLLWRIRRRTH
ncbi:SURF1 family protein [Paracoccaceae bacterium Fryx2]|nr:SURF1 family protein [Paracoccaceae bacterium Fryx2]